MVGSRPELMGEVDRIHIGLIRKVGLGALVVYLTAVPAVAVFNRPLAVGIALGGGFVLGLMGLYRALAPAMFAAPEARRSRVIFWIAWLLKWPVMGAVLFFAFRSRLAAPMGVGLGAGIVPAVAVALVFRALLVDLWGKWRGGLQAS